MLYVSALRSQLRHDMIRSRFQHSFVIQSVLQSYLVGFVLLYVQHCNCSHLPQCYFSASVPSLKCARARGMGSMSSCYYRAVVSLSKPIMLETTFQLSDMYGHALDMHVHIPDMHGHGHA